MSTTALAVKMVMDRWNGSILNFTKTLNTLTDEQLQKEVAPGKNRGIYLLGHLIAVHDDMLRLLDWGEKKYPELTGPFLKEADKAVELTPSVAELRNMWNDQTSLFQEKLAAMSPEAWFEKHTAVAAADFAKEPHRNKLNIIISRTSHLEYHMGQLILLR